MTALKGCSGAVALEICQHRYVSGFIEPGVLYTAFLYVNLSTGIADRLGDLATIFIPLRYCGLAVRPDEGRHNTRLTNLYRYHGDQAVSLALLLNDR